MTDEAKRLMQELPLADLGGERSTLVALTPDGTIAWVNDGWARFARENGGSEVSERFGVGSVYLDGMTGVLRARFGAILRDALATGVPSEHDYECSSPSTVRRFRCRVLPLGKVGTLVEHALLVESPRPAAGTSPPEEQTYRSREGLVVQCSNCRKVRHAQMDRWDVVVPWIARPPARTSHGLCGVCLGFYFPDEGEPLP